MPLRLGSVLDATFSAANIRKKSKREGLEGEEFLRTTILRDFENVLNIVEKLLLFFLIQSKMRYFQRKFNQKHAFPLVIVGFLLYLQRV